MAEHRSLRVAGVVVVALAALATLGAADARPSGRDGAGATVTATAGSRVTAAERAAARARYGIPVLAPNPYAEPYDGKGSATAVASKLRTTIAVPESTFLSYLRLCVQVADQGTFDPANCPEFSPPRTSFDASDSLPIWLLASGPVWVASPPGSRLRYGSFAPVPVRTLAFGSIPVSAVVHISQPVGRNGDVSPLALDYLSNSNTNPADGGRVYANGKYPGFVIPPGTTSYLVEKFLVSGPVDVRLSDVKIDGRKVDVGGSCRTSRPGRLQLGSPAGYYQFDTPAADLRGRPGGAQVLNIDGAGTAQGAVSVPAFAGCRDGRGSLDPLLTNLVSGTNPLEVAFTVPFNACSRDDRTRPCPAFPKAASATPQVLSAGSRAARSVVRGPARSSARWSALPASARERLVTMIATLPAANRSLVYTALPPEAQAAVLARVSAKR